MGIIMTGHSESDALLIAQIWAEEGRTLALATVVETWGSAPRRTGSHLVIDSEGNFEGSVSGGCVEGAVVVEAMTVMSDNKPCMLEYGVEDETAWRVGLSCGGRIRVYVQPILANSNVGLSAALLQRINLEREARRGVIVQTDMNTGKNKLVIEDEMGPLEACLKIGRSVMVGEAGNEVFLTVLVPPARIIAIGAVHISKALVPMCKVAGYDLTIIDPRGAFASPERFPGARLVCEWPKDAFKAIKLDKFTALAALTHDPKIDDFAIAAALVADCFYVGALGSRKTHAKRQTRLTNTGATESSLARISSPIGLDIGAVNPEEIAVSVLAEIIQALRGSKRPVIVPE